MNNRKKLTFQFIVLLLEPFINTVSKQISVRIVKIFVIRFHWIKYAALTPSV